MSGAISAGTQVGPYEIISLLGLGGMGEVYRARDRRLDRDVAIKMLPAAFAADGDRLRRFEQEARAAGALNHPNILAIYDLGTHEGSPYLVCELLEGETLRQAQGESPLPFRRAVDYASQIARGLAAAHLKGIVHRDLKPENLFLMRDGRVKILDFGLAKFQARKASADDKTSAPTVAVETSPGMVMGTVGYMSPEQVRGQPADHRTDIFSFGAILYEMLAGKRAFRGESSVETMNAILREDPPELISGNTRIAPAMERLLRHCLEKSPEQRFQSAQDLAFDLESLSGISSQSSPHETVAPVRSRRWLWPALGLIAPLVVVALGVFLLAGKLSRQPAPYFKRLTFRNGYVSAARFAPDGKTIIYSAAWDGESSQIFSARTDGTESRALDLRDTDIASISSTGEMALLLHRGRDLWGANMTLARAPLAGGAPRELVQNVRSADWSPDGSSLAIVQTVGGRDRVEYPVGKILYESGGYITDIRVSPEGNLVAFLDHPSLQYEHGYLITVDSGGRKKVVLEKQNFFGLRWSTSGNELWYSRTDFGPPAVFAMDLSGKERRILRGIGALILNDLSHDGHVLLSHVTWKTAVNCMAPGQNKERDLAWLDFSIGNDLSANGKMLLFTEGREGGGAMESVYLRNTDGAPAVRLGDGEAQALSPDGQRVLSLIQRASPPQLRILPVGAGQPKTVNTAGLALQAATWFPDGQRILLQANEPGKSPRLYLCDETNAKPKPLTPEGTFLAGVSPDGKLIAAYGASSQILLYPLEGQEQPRPLAGVAPGERLIRWSGAGESVYVRSGYLPVKVYRVNLATQARELWKEIMPSDPAGVTAIDPILIAPDGKSYAYTSQKNLSNLYLVDGLK